MMRFVSVVLLLTVLVAPLTVAAQSDTFTISVYAGEDTVPPTTPSILSATPVASTQIDVVWTAVTDDMMVGGYVLFRDGVAIATTTLTNFSDTGLTASTTYAYNVQAYDTSFNYSSSSATTTATTLSTPVVPPTTPSTGGQTGTVARPVLESIVVTPAETSATLEIAMAMPSRFEVRWGKTTMYEMGSSIGGVFSREYLVEIGNLEPATRYYYEVVAVTPTGVERVVKQGDFMTLGNQVLTTPPNVSWFAGERFENDVLLSWNNTAVPPGGSIRIVRSYNGFPLFPTDGVVVYQGIGSTYRDQGALATRSPAYYTAFTYDAFGAVSSGAVVVVYGVRVTPPPTPTTPTTPVTPPVVLPPLATTTPSSTTPTVETTDQYDERSHLLPLLSELQLVQTDRMYSFDSADITLLATDSLLVRIPKAVVGGAFKSIIGTIPHPTEPNTAFSFLLRINADETAYEAVLAPVGITGQTRVLLSIYNYDTLVIATYSTPVTFVLPTKDIGTFIGVSSLSCWWCPPVVLALGLVFWWTIFNMARRREWIL